MSQHFDETDILDTLDLSLEDFLTQEELDRLTREKRKQAQKPKQAEEAPLPKPKPSPWHCTKATLIMVRTQCKCGQVYHHPGARVPLAHFEHKTRPDMIHEAAAHPSTLNEQLPRVVRWLTDHVEACPSCFLQEDGGGEGEEETHL